MDGELSVRYIGNPARPSPAQSSVGFHKKEHVALVREAFKGADDDTDKESSPEDIQEKPPKRPTEETSRMHVVGREEVGSAG